MTSHKMLINYCRYFPGHTHIFAFHLTFGTCKLLYQIKSFHIMQRKFYVNSLSCTFVRQSATNSPMEIWGEFHFTKHFRVFPLCFLHAIFQTSQKVRQFDCRNSERLTHWGRVTHICVVNLVIIGSDNGLSPGRRQAIFWSNDGILLIVPPGTNFSET